MSHYVVPSFGIEFQRFDRVLQAQAQAHAKAQSQEHCYMDKVQTRGPRAQHCTETRFLLEVQKKHMYIKLLVYQLASAGVFCESKRRHKVLQIERTSKAS